MFGNRPCGKLTIRLMNETPGPGGWGEKLVRNWEGVFPEMSRSGMRTGTCWVCFWEKDALG